MPSFGRYRIRGSAQTNPNIVLKALPVHSMFEDRSCICGRLAGKNRVLGEAGLKGAGWRRLSLIGLVIAGGFTIGRPAVGAESPMPVKAVAEEANITSGIWSLERAIERALAANAEVLAAQHDLERQEGVRLQFVARLLPSVSASASANERAEGLVDRTPHLPPSQDTAVALFGYEMRVEVRQLVFDGFGAWHQVQRQRLLSQQASLALQGTVIRTVSLVRQGFDAILLRTTQVEAERRRLEEHTQVAKWTARKHAEGEVPEFELLRAEAELEGVRADLAEANRLLSQSEQSFRRLLQISDVAGPLRLVGTFEPRTFTLPLDEAIAQARARRPDLRSAAVGVEAARRAQMADTAGYLPKIEAFASYGARSSYYNSAIERDGWTYGVMGQWSVFDGGAARGRRISLRADRRGAEAKLAETEQAIVSKLYEYYEGLRQARAAMDAQEKSVSTSARASRDARRLYDEGQASLEQVLQAGMTYRRVETRRSELIYNYNAIVAEIESAIGGQLSEPLRLSQSWKHSP